MSDVDQDKYLTKQDKMFTVKATRIRKPVSASTAALLRAYFGEVKSPWRLEKKEFK